MEKVIRDGKVAVLYSPGFGAGWSTWIGDEYAEWALFSKEVVEWVEGGKKEDIEGIAKKNGVDSYLGGADKLEIEWLPIGTRFEIHEYDGSESVEILTPESGFVA